MCTVIIHVPPSAAEPARLLAVRDEDPARPWRPLGEWWPERPGVVGVQDVRAGGAWLAADPTTRRLAVLLNRADRGELAADAVISRGVLALDSVAGRSPGEEPPTRGFNLLEVSPGAARVVSWDGASRRIVRIPPGTHMIAHDEVDDPATARITHWLEHFRLSAPVDGPEWYAPWLAVLARSAELGPLDDRAIIRDNTPHGYPTLSLLVCAASVGPDAVDVRAADLPVPGVWSPLTLR
ncbi:MAG: NRDE family protein [Microbacterium sp.]|uniref:NRDE family protein n=1 Tax=Microbacterium sp. TaxID=51671 RepID=UPI0039E448D2